ncbi:MAG: AMIN domain-containing protein, partial [Lachnospiraceae bacterium]|nr:AMIN domain-containing protein [Lachnospiraceae bacterium]
IFTLSVFSVIAYGATTELKITYDGKTYNYSAQEVNITVEGVKITEYTMPPIILESRTLVPARAVFEAMGGDVAWNADTQEVYIVRGDDLVVIQINNSMGTKNGEVFVMDVAPKIINNSTMIPVRAVSEALGCDVSWDGNTRTVKITEKKVDKPIIVGGEDNGHTGDVSEGELISLRSVSIPESEAAAQIFTIKASSRIEKYDVLEVGGDRIAIDIYDATINMAGSSKAVSTSPYVKNIRWAQNQTDPTYIARVVFDLNTMADYEVSISADRKSISLSYSENCITSLTTDSSRGIDYINIKGDSAPDVSIQYLSGPNRVVLDIPYAISELKSKYSASGLEWITSIRTSQYDEKTVRIVLEVEAGTEVELVQEDNVAQLLVYKSTVENILYTKDNVLVFAKGAMDIDSNDIETEDDYLNREYRLILPDDYEGVYGYGRMRIGSEFASGIYLETVGGETVVTIDQERIFEVNLWEDSKNVYVELLDPRDVYDFVVVIDAGHGAKDPGTSGNGMVEKELNLDILLMLKDMLERERDIKVYYTRIDDSYPENVYRAFMGNSAADLFISIHHNASVSDVPNGTETLYAVHSNDKGKGLTSKKAAEIIHSYVIDALDTFDRGIKERPDLIVLNQTTVPAVLVEAAFLSNAEDAEKMADEDYRFFEAEALYEAICEIFDEYGR